jgi:hypothetical protein
METAKIVPLWGQDIPEGGAYPSVVEALEDWLARARRGEFMAVAMTGVRPNTNIAYRYASNSGSQDVMLVGGLAAASHAILMNSSAKDMEPTVGPENAPA